MSIERTIAAEHEAHWDGDLWRSYCGPGSGGISYRKRDPRICGFCTRATMEPRDGQGICARCGWNTGTFGYEELMRMRA
jgi:hypothetical protein